MCVSKFDSTSVFARILYVNAGHFSVIAKNYKVESKYVTNTAIVKFIFKTKVNSFVLKDFMSPAEDNKNGNQFLIRKFIGTKGENVIEFNFSPKINYGKKFPEVLVKKNKLVFNIDDKKIILHLPDSSRITNNKNNYNIRFSLKKKETKTVILEFFNEKKRSGISKHKEFEKETIKFWRDWIEAGKYFQYKHDLLVRSMITLKLLHYHPDGSLVAAPTTSFPTQIGGSRNWDYRYTWIRDATFTLFAFHILDCEEEIYRFFNFIYDILEKKQDGNPKFHTAIQ